MLCAGRGGCAVGCAFSAHVLRISSFYLNDEMSEQSAHDAFATLHSRPVASPSFCKANYRHDQSTLVLSSLIVIGLVISYLPQHIRIIANKSSDGFSTWFLLLGAVGSASSLFNIVVLQWSNIECCRYLSAGQCIESTLGVIQVAFQWACFYLVFILYLVYFPKAQRYVRALPYSGTSLIPSFFRRNRTRSDSASSDESEEFDPRSVLLPSEMARTEVQLAPVYRQALTVFVVTIVHLFFCALTTFILLFTLPRLPPPEDTPDPWPPGKEHASEKAVRIWATALGSLAVVLATVQYVPQLVLTARRKTVGSLSIPMMCLQVPGSFVFVYTLAVRPGVDWTGWATFLVTGLLQAGLLTLCILWKRRQAKLGIDDWGQPVDGREGEQRPLLS